MTKPLFLDKVRDFPCARMDFLRKNQKSRKETVLLNLMKYFEFSRQLPVPFFLSPSSAAPVITDVIIESDQLTTIIETKTRETVSEL